MLMRTLDGEDCPDCGGAVLVGTKREPSHAKVFVACDGCGREVRAGTVDHDASAEDVADVAARAV